MTVITASAPSNIALIKYMGKTDPQSNLPTNSSLSWTLESLRSYVRLTPDSSFSRDQWSPLKAPGIWSMDLSEKGKQRFLSHFQNLKTEFGIQENFQIESGNNFPADCGLASSASSFAALTQASIEAFQKLGSVKASELTIIEKAELSRKGSGSSCRSFFGPWALWFSAGVRPIEFPMRPLLHQVLIVEDSVKAVSSSEAHLRVSSSPLFEGRPERAERRLAELMELFRKDSAETPPSWKQAFQICWDEFQDMHQLFETSQPAFSYKNEMSRSLLNEIQKDWESQNDGPLATMDAGANIHLLFRQDQKELAELTQKKFASKVKVFSSQEIKDIQL